jgi:hypothetical protein
MVKRTLTPSALVVHPRAMGQQQFHHGEIAVHCCEMDRPVILNIAFCRRVRTRLQKQSGDFDVSNLHGDVKGAHGPSPIPGIRVYRMWRRHEFSNDVWFRYRRPRQQEATKRWGQA